MMKYPLRSNDIRERNEKLVLNLIFTNGSMSQSRIVQETGLKAPTVFRIFAKLEEAGMIRQCTAAESEEERPAGERKGRRPSFYCIEPSSGYAIGVDFSRLAAAVIVVNLANEVIYRFDTEVGDSPDRVSILDTIGTMIDEAIEQSAIDREALIGIGIASPGRVDTVEGRVVEYRRIPGLAGYSIKKHFERTYGVPVYVHNNSSVIAASAYHYGTARAESSLLAVLVRSGVGGALVNHGEIFLNGTTTVLEIGRLKPPCDSGDPERESLESIVSEPAMLDSVRAATGVESWEDADRTLAVEDLVVILARAREALADAVRNLYHVFHPEAVLLTSRFSVITQVLGSAIRDAVPGCRVIESVYDPVQACYGATDLVFAHFFLRSPDRLQPPTLT